MGRGMARNLHSAGLLRAVWNRTSARVGGTGRRDRRRQPRRVLRTSLKRCDVIVTVRRCGSGRAAGHRRARARAAGQARSSSTARRSVRDTARAAAAKPRGDAMSNSSMRRSAAASKARATARSRSWPVAPRRLLPARCRCCRRWARTVTHFGPNGAGQAAKATNQIMCAGVIQAVAEAMAFAKAQGLPLAQLIETLGKGAGSSWYFVNRAPNIVRDAFPAGFRVRLHAKDLRICHDMAARLGVALPVVEIDARAVPRTDRAGSRRRRHLGAVPPQGRAVRNGRGQARDGARLAMSEPPVVRGDERPMRRIFTCRISASHAPSSPSC